MRWDLGAKNIYDEIVGLVARCTNEARIRERERRARSAIMGRGQITRDNRDIYTRRLSIRLLTNHLTSYRLRHLLSRLIKLV